jgi:carbon storage regulator
MLVLSRKIGEHVIIGDSIRVTVVSIRGDKVRLGFTAPDEVTVHREEVYRKIRSTSDDKSIMKETEPVPASECSVW